MPQLSSSYSKGWGLQSYDLYMCSCIQLAIKQAKRNVQYLHSNSNKNLAFSHLETEQSKAIACKENNYQVNSIRKGMTANADSLLQNETMNKLSQ